MEFVQNFTPPDIQAKNFTPSISPNFNSLVRKHKKLVKMEKFTPLAKNLHCRRQWGHGQIPPLSSSINDTSNSHHQQHEHQKFPTWGLCYPPGAVLRSCAPKPFLCKIAKIFSAIFPRLDTSVICFLLVWKKDGSRFITNFSMIAQFTMQKSRLLTESSGPVVILRGYQDSESQNLSWHNRSAERMTSIIYLFLRKSCLQNVFVISYLYFICLSNFHRGLVTRQLPHNF